MKHGALMLLFTFCFLFPEASLAEDQVTARERSDCHYNGGKWDGYRCTYPHGSGSSGQVNTPASGPMVVYNYCPHDVVFLVAFVPAAKSDYVVSGWYELKQQLNKQDQGSSLSNLLAGTLKRMNMEGVKLRNGSRTLIQNNDRKIYLYARSNRNSGFKIQGGRDGRQFVFEKEDWVYSFVEAKVTTNTNGEAVIGFC